MSKSTKLLIFLANVKFLCCKYSLVFLLPFSSDFAKNIILSVYQCLLIINFDSPEALCWK